MGTRKSDVDYDTRSSTVTRSFRFENELSKILEDEAERMGISVNALVGIILRRYCEFTRYLSKIDMSLIANFSPSFWRHMMTIQFRKWEQSWVRLFLLIRSCFGRKRLTNILFLNI
jgi:hypothetical protein